MSDYQKDQEANDLAERIWPWLWIGLLGLPAGYAVWTFWPIIKFGITGVFPQ